MLDERAFKVWDDNEQDQLVVEAYLADGIPHQRRCFVEAFRGMGGRTNAIAHLQEWLAQDDRDIRANRVQVKPWEHQFYLIGWNGGLLKNTTLEIRRTHYASDETNAKIAQDAALYFVGWLVEDPNRLNKRYLFDSSVNPPCVVKE